MEKAFMMKFTKRNKELLFFLGLTALYLVWSTDNFFKSAGVGLDPSWIIGLNWGSNIGVQWGKDFVFTYGPLFHFTGRILPNFYSPHIYLLIQIGLNLFFSAIKAGVVFLFYRRTQFPGKTYAVIFPGLVMLLSVHVDDLYLELIAFFAVLLLCDSFYELCTDDTTINRRPIVNTVVTALLLVITQYAKFSFFCSAAILITLFNILCIFRRKYKVAAIFTGSYVVFSILLWIGLGQNMRNLFGYIYTGLQITSGYNSVMSLHNSLAMILVCIFELILIVSFLFLLIYCVMKKKLFYFISMLLISPQFFLLFKEGFVRADPNHFNSFIGGTRFIALYIMFVSILSCSTLCHPLHKQNKLFVVNTSNIVLVITIIVICISMSIVNSNNNIQILNDYMVYEKNILETKQRQRYYYNDFN